MFVNNVEWWVRKLYWRIEEEIEKNGSVDTLFLQKEFTMSALHAMRLKEIIDKKGCIWNDKEC